jgi:hypothetical protein
MKAFKIQPILSNRIGRLICAASLLTALAGTAAAQDQQPTKHSQKARQYYDLYQQPTSALAPSRLDRADFDRSGTRGREGLGEDPRHPEGPGNISN